MTEQFINGNDEDKEISVLNQTTKEMCHDSIFNSQKLFLANQSFRPPEFSEATKLRLMVKIRDEYKTIYEKPKETQKDKKLEQLDSMFIQEEKSQLKNNNEQQQQTKETDLTKLIHELPQEQQQKLSKIPKQFLSFQNKPQGETFLQSSSSSDQSNQKQLAVVNQRRVGSLLATKIKKLVKPTWHPPWKLMRVIAGHQGWVRCVDVDSTNQWFVTGSNDRTIKFWDLASGQLKLTLPGHISAVRSVIVSNKHTYLYSCSEDKTVKCWDLEANKIIRNYHGHLSGVMCLALHPELDLLISGGRDSTLRVWDIRTKAQVHVLEGHKHVVSSVAAQEYEPQVISGSHDQTVRLWDIGTGKTVEVLTNHKKSVRSLLFHHEEYTFCSGASDNIKVWKCPEGKFLRNISGHTGIVNTTAINSDNVLVSGGDNGVLKFWDWKSGYNFQTINIKPQPGSISSEAGVFAAKFDKSQMRLITCECDKTIKIWKEDETATEETHPIDPDFRMAFENQRF